MRTGRGTGPSVVCEESDEKRSDPCVESVVCPSSDNVSAGMNIKTCFRAVGGQTYLQTMGLKHSFLLALV